MPPPSEFVGSRNLILENAKTVGSQCTEHVGEVRQKITAGRLGSLNLHKYCLKHIYMGHARARSLHEKLRDNRGSPVRTDRFSLRLGKLQ